MQKLVERYTAPTPSWARKIGGALFLVGNFVTGDALLSAHPVMGTLGMALTVGSKLMNLFVDNTE